jgi:hypothetical protein
MRIRPELSSSQCAHIHNSIIVQADILGAGTRGKRNRKEKKKQKKEERKERERKRKTASQAVPPIP